MSDATQGEPIPAVSDGDERGGEPRPGARRIGEYLGARLHCATAVERVDLEDGLFTSFGDDDRKLMTSRNLLFCCGAQERPLPGLQVHRERWEGSGRFLLRDDLAGLASAGPIVIVGASHSAFSCAWRLLHDPLFEDFARGREIVILQRRERIKLRCTPEFAAEHALDYDPENDVCPASGIVFRNGGLRKDAKALYLDIRDGRERRVKIVIMDALEEQQARLRAAGLILQATGFEPRLPRLSVGGEAVEVGDPTQDGELRDLASGRIIAGLYGMGLGLNILPDGPPRGEASFHGGIHGLQSYPLAIAPRLIDKLCARLTPENSVEN